MEDHIIQDGYGKIKKKAKLLYAELGEVWCPSLKDHVLFSRIGFQHLIRPNHIQRPKSEQKRRFALLSMVKGIIENPDVTIKYQRRETMHVIKLNGEKNAVTSQTDFWEFAEERDGGMVKVIIRQFPGGKKHFLSVYQKKEKPSSQ